MAPRGLAPTCLALVLALAAGCARDPSDTTEVAPLAAAEPAPEVSRIPGALVVDFRDGTRKAQFDGWEKDWGLDLEFNSAEGAESGITLATGVADVEGALARIRQHAEVEAAEPLYSYEASFVPNDPEYGKQWNLKLINAPDAWDTSRGKGVIVAVLDTGIAYENKDDFILVPDLQGATFAKGFDFVNDREGAWDDHGHGTHVAGTIAQVTHNQQGVAGVAFEATLMPVKVLDAFGRGTSSDIADAIRWAADHGAKVINLSLGGGARSEVMARAVKYARKKGTTVVAAAGNTGQSRVEYPAAYPGAVAVAAVGPSGKLAPYSSWGAELDIAAPGGDKSARPEDGVLQNTIDPRDPSKSVYAFYQGTSMATPHVAGVAALLYAAGASGPDEVEKALFEGARTPDGEKAWSEKYGHGLLDAKGALAALGKGPLGVTWGPLLVALVLLVGVLLSIGRRQRPAYLNLVFTPAFLIPLVLATVGMFVVRFFHGAAPEGASALVEVASLPIPDWERVIFGRGKLANPLFYSALIPIIASILAIKAKSLRPLIAGLSIGFGGFLAYAAWSKAPGLAYLPFSFLAVPWLVVNGVICLLIARAMLRKEPA